MAKYRQIHTHIWKDSWFLEIESDAKLFFIYLFSNERASISGIYELPGRVMSFESGIPKNRIDTLFLEFETVGKAYYDDGVVWVPNLRKYHETKSPKVQTAILSDVKALKDCKLKGMYCERYGIDTVCILSSSSSISSGSSLSDGPLNKMITALSAISRETLWSKTERDFEDAAYELIGRDAEIEDIRLFGDWWAVNGWHKQKPVLKNILDSWGDFKNGVTLEDTTPSNGKTKQQSADHLVSLVAKYSRHGAKAKAELSKDDWAIVEKMGGWGHVRMMTEEKIKIGYHTAKKEASYG